MIQFVAGNLVVVRSTLGNQLPSKVIRKRAQLERWSSTPRINGVKLDRIQLILGQDGDELAGLQLGPAHPSRSDGYP